MYTESLLLGNQETIYLYFDCYYHKHCVVVHLLFFTGYYMFWKVHIEFILLYFQFEFGLRPRIHGFV